MDLVVGTVQGDPGVPMKVSLTMMLPLEGVGKKEFNSVRYADGFCSWDVALIVMVMAVGWPNVESLCAVISPG